MKQISPHALRTTLLLAVVQVGLLLCPTLHAAVTFTVTPTVVSNTYNGVIKLQVKGLNTGETVVVQEFMDLNGNGVIDAGDWLVQQFQLTDGQAGMVIGGIVNSNVPGDADSTAGQIAAQLNFNNGDLAQLFSGKYLYKLSSPTGRFTPITIPFSVTSFPYAQKFTGHVVSSGTDTTVPNAIVVLLNGNGSGVEGVVADNSGTYTIQAPPGAYTLVAFKSNYVFNVSAQPVLTLGSGQTATTNLTVANATASISGMLVDANNRAIGLPGVLVSAQADNGVMAVTVTDTNGSFTLGVQSGAGPWGLYFDQKTLITQGYVGLQNGTNVAAGATGITLAVPRATALFYGSVKDNLGNSLPGVEVEADDNNGLYACDGYTDANGNYFAAVLGGLGSNDLWYVNVSSDHSPANYIFSQPAFDQNGGANVSNGQAVPASFTALLAANHIGGTVKDSNGDPIGGVGVWASAAINFADYFQYADAVGNGKYSLNVANGNWTIGVECSGGSDSLDNILGSGYYQCPDNEIAAILNDNATNNFTVQLCTGVAITTTWLPAGQVDVYYDQFLQASSCSSTFGWSLTSGSLPPGLAGDPSTGEIFGTPTNAGTFNFTVQVTDGNGLTATQALSLTISGGTLQVTTASLSSGTDNVVYNSQQLTASGGEPPYKWSLAEGVLPPGLTLSTNGLISGTPTNAGTFNFVARVTDSLLATATQTLSVVVYTLSSSVTFSVTPSAVSNFYAGVVTLQAGGLNRGETVLVEKFLDINGNGVIDAEDAKMQQFQLTDGQASVFYDGATAVTNFNVPGDLTPADGAITAQLHPAISGTSQLIVGQYAFRLSSPTGRFPPITNLFNVTNSAYAQSFTGNVVCGGTNVPHAVACLFTPPAGPSMTVIAGTLADGSGGYRLNAPPGTYLLWALKDGFVADAASGPVLALGANATISTNLVLLPATCSISGRCVDAANTNAGLPCVVVKAATEGFMATSIHADDDGNFTVGATPDGWFLLCDSQNLDSKGYLGSQAFTYVNAASGSVAGLTIALARGTALAYGSVKDAQNRPLAGVRLSGNQNDGAGPYAGDATTDQNGNYAMAVNDAGVWNVGIAGNNPAFPNYVWSGGLGDTAFTQGQAVQQNFTAIPANHVISGHVQQANGDPIGGVGVWASATINSVDYVQPADTDGNGDYTLNVANGSWTVGLETSGGNDSLDAILGSGNYQAPDNEIATILNDNATNSFTVQLCSGVAITTTSLPAGQVNVYYYQFLQASSCNPAFTWSLVSGSPPPGLTGASSGEIYGTPTNAGTFTFTVQVTDGNGDSTNQTLSIYIAPSSSPLQVATSYLPNATNGLFYSQALQAFGGQTPYRWSIPDYSVGPPPDLTLSPSGVFSGTPDTNAGSYGFYVRVTDAASNEADSPNPLLLNIVNPPLQITNLTLPAGAVGAFYSAQLGAIGGQPPYSWGLAVASAGLPGGLSLDLAGLISGTPTNSKASTFRVEATDANYDTAYQVLSITINPALVLGSPSWQGNRFQMRLTGATGQNYTVQMSTNLRSTNWTSIALTNSATTNSFIVIDPNATDKQRFYRVEVGP
jgi:hypothetical protein